MACGYFDLKQLQVDNAPPHIVDAHVNVDIAGKNGASKL